METAPSPASCSSTSPVSAAMSMSWYASGRRRMTDARACRTARASQLPMPPPSPGLTATTWPGVLTSSSS